MKCVVDRYKWHRPFQMTTTVLRNGNDRLRKGNLRRRGSPTSFPGSLFSASNVVETMEAEKRDPGNEVGGSHVGGKNNSKT